MPHAKPSPPGPRVTPEGKVPSQNTTSLSPLPHINQLPLTPSSPRLSRREARLAKKRTSSPSSFSSSPIESPTSALAAAEMPPLAKNLLRTLLSPKPPPSTPPRPLFIASLGNPGAKYERTLHSAGHILADELVRSPSHSFEPFTRSRAYGKLWAETAPTSRSASTPSDWTLWKSPSLMNISGVDLAKAYGAWKESSLERRESGVLVVLHDELESALGKVRVVQGKASAKGHRGVNSIQVRVGMAGWVRVAVGIGRPTSREPEDVARWVLRKMTEVEWAAVCNAMMPVMGLLRRIEEQGT